MIRDKGEIAIIAEEAAKANYLETTTDPFTGYVQWRCKSLGNWKVLRSEMTEKEIRDEVLKMVGDMRENKIAKEFKPFPGISNDSVIVGMSREGKPLVKRGNTYGYIDESSDPFDEDPFAPEPESSHTGSEMYARYKENLVDHAASALSRARRAVYYESLARECNIPVDALLFPRTYWEEKLKVVKGILEDIKRDVSVTLTYKTKKREYHISHLRSEEKLETVALSQSDATRAMLDYEGWISRTIELIDKIRVTENIEGDADDPCEPPLDSYVME